MARRPQISRAIVLCPVAPSDLRVFFLLQGNVAQQVGGPPRASRLLVEILKTKRERERRIGKTVSDRTAAQKKWCMSEDGMLFLAQPRRPYACSSPCYDLCHFSSSGRSCLQRRQSSSGSSGVHTRGRLRGRMPPGKLSRLSSLSAGMREHGHQPHRRRAPEPLPDSAEPLRKFLRRPLRGRTTRLGIRGRACALKQLFFEKSGDQPRRLFVTPAAEVHIA